MAGIRQRENGNWFVRFLTPDGERRTIALGTRSERQALTVKLKIENLLSARETGTPVDPETALWLAKMKPTLREKLVACGLLDAAPTDEPAPPAGLTLGTHLDAYVQRRHDAKPSTRTNWAHTVRNLKAFFGADKPVSEITIGDARDFERYLKTTAREMRYGDAEMADGLKPATLAKRIQNSKQFLQDAVDRGLIPSNPFSGLKCSQKANRQRDFFVTREMAQAVLDACPDDEWRALFVLSRFCGLRCPSEHLLLRWSDVDWARGRLLVHAPKTEHHEGKGTRWVPIFPEVRPILERLFDAAPDGADYVITRYRRAEQNLRTTLTKIVHRAGLTMWPKAFQNLRASCETELMERFPAHVVVAWIGHTERIAQQHYLQVTDEHFEAALRGPEERSICAPPALHARSSDAMQSPAKAPKSPPVLAILGNSLHPHEGGVGDAGLEPVTSAV